MDNAVGYIPFSHCLNCLNRWNNGLLNWLLLACLNMNYKVWLVLHSWESKIIELIFKNTDQIRIFTVHLDYIKIFTAYLHRRLLWGDWLFHHFSCWRLLGLWFLRAILYLWWCYCFDRRWCLRNVITQLNLHPQMCRPLRIGTENRTFSYSHSSINFEPINYLSEQGWF